MFNQPEDQKLGDQLEELLHETDYNTFYITVAYARQSGVSRLQPYLEHFDDKGGQIKAIVGIDQSQTSQQALRQLHSVCTELYTYHSESITQTFHPKVYTAEQENDKGLLFVGSNNLTAGGLYTNYETYTKIEYDLSDSQDESGCQEARSIFQYYSRNDSDMCLEINSETIEELIDGGYLADEASTRSQIASRASEIEDRPDIFGSEQFDPPSVETLPANSDEVDEGTV